MSVPVIIAIVVAVLLVILFVFSSIFDIVMGLLMSIGGLVFKLFMNSDQSQDFKTEYFTNHGITDYDVYAYALIIAGAALFVIGIIRYIIIKVSKHVKQKRENENVTEPKKQEKVKAKKENKIKESKNQPKQQETKKCPSCGAELNVDAKFCSKCGTKF